MENQTLTGLGPAAPVDANDNFFQSWLVQQCQYHEGIKAGILFMPLKEGQPFQSVAFWPEQNNYSESLSSLTREIIDKRSALVTTLSQENSGAELFAIGYPVIADDRLLAIHTLVLQADSKQHLQQVMQMMQWSSASIELLLLKAEQQSSEGHQSRLEQSVDLFASVQSEPNYSSAAMRLVTELAVSLNCDRVSLGRYHKGRSRIQHLSHSTQFGKKMNLVRCIEEVMDEAVDQQQAVIFPVVDTNEGSVVRAHQKLSQEQGDACVLTIPLHIKTEMTGALTFERNPDQPFSDDEIQLCESIAALLAPSLEDKRLNDRIILVKAAESFGLQLKRLLGKGYLGRKLFLLIVVGAVLFFSLAKGSYRLSADAQLDSYIQRVVAAPYEGYIYSAVHRAGDVVKQGQELVKLDDRDLRLEKLKWLSEQAKLNRQYQEALAIHDRAKLNIINAQKEQIAAQLELVESQLKRAILTAPFDGLIVSGDLTQRLGGAVEKGEVLFEVSPLHFYRINLWVKESRIADLSIGQNGTLHLSALPEQPFDFVVTKITPLTEAKDGATYFAVEAALQGQSEQLQPGMEGIGKIYIDDRLLISIWTRELLEWFRLKLWSWWG